MLEEAIRDVKRLRRRKTKGYEGEGIKERYEELLKRREELREAIEYEEENRGEETRIVFVDEELEAGYGFGAEA